MDAPINPNDPRPDPGSGRSAGAHQPRSAPHGGRSDPFDTLADLFLGPPVRIEATSPAPLRLVGENPPAPAPEKSAPRAAPNPAPRIRPGPRAEADGPLIDPPARAGVTIEGLVLGHLPIFASAWATQYAKHVAETSRTPVAFLRFTGDRASLDLFLPGPAADPAAGASTLAEAVARASTHAPRWIVRLPDACEPDLADGAVDVLTLLTGADEAAVVACYRTLKSLSSAANEPTDVNSSGGPEQWRVAVMGSDPVKSAQAGAKVRRAAEAFLDSSLDISACVARIGALKSAQLYDGPASLSWRQTLDLIRSTPQVPPPPHTPTAPPRQQPPSSALSPRVEVRPITSDPTRFEARPVPPAPSARTSGVPALAGLRPSVARCPAFPAIELASDADGRLHLIAPADTANAVAALVAVSSWAREHASLITLADPALVQTHEPTLHYLTTEPAAARRLLDTAIRVHAVVRVGSQSTTIDLN